MGMRMQWQFNNWKLGLHYHMFAVELRKHPAQTMALNKRYVECIMWHEQVQDNEMKLMGAAHG